MSANAPNGSRQTVRVMMAVIITRLSARVRVPTMRAATEDSNATIQAKMMPIRKQTRRDANTHLAELFGSKLANMTAKKLCPMTQQNKTTHELIARSARVFVPGLRLVFILRDIPSSALRLRVTSKTCSLRDTAEIHPKFSAPSLGPVLLRLRQQASSALLGP